MLDSRKILTKMETNYNDDTFPSENNQKRLTDFRN